ncbi:MAG: hypothetical protein H7X88_03920 [Gloeobacteraceae cyanobacterium ES-bin-316]|nr:hypothetical protein [Ferruginibacter sp.]
MKTNVYKVGRAMLLALMFLFSHSFTKLHAQQFLTTIDGWNAYVHLPDEYNDSVGKRYPVIIFISGIGEVGTNPNKLLTYGPSKFVAAGNKMHFLVNGKLEKPIVISIQPIDPWTPSAITMHRKIDSIVNRWRCDVQRISGTGLSMGGSTWGNYVSFGQPAMTNRLSSLVIMSSSGPETGLSSIKNFGIGGGKWWGLEGTTDPREMDKIRDTLNLYKFGSARYYKYIGGHCCWNTWYDPSWNENGESIYTWMLKQKRPASANVTPESNAGRDTVISNVIATINLKGNGNDPDGNPIVFTWRKINGPAGSIIANAASAQTTVTGLVMGVYNFELTVSDVLGAVDKDTITIVDGNAVLPLTLVEFNAVEKNDHILLQWKTSSEINSSHFEIEKLQDAQLYVKAGTVDAIGRNSPVNKYQYADNFAEEGVNYYRLKIVDKDGQFVYSKILAITVKKSKNLSMAIHSLTANRTELSVRMNSPAAMQGNLVVMDIQGKLFYKSPVFLNKGLNIIKKPGNFVSAIYVLKIITNTGFLTQSFIVE